MIKRIAIATPSKACIDVRRGYMPSIHAHLSVSLARCNFYALYRCHISSVSSWLFRPPPPPCKRSPIPSHAATRPSLSLSYFSLSRSLRLSSSCPFTSQGSMSVYQAWCMHTPHTNRAFAPDRRVGSDRLSSLRRPRSLLRYSDGAALHLGGPTAAGLPLPRRRAYPPGGPPPRSARGPKHSRSHGPT